MKGESVQGEAPHGRIRAIDAANRLANGLTRFLPLSDPTLSVILCAGALLRLIVFHFLGPMNNDDHYSVIYYILTRHGLPTSDVLPESYHPPLYYLLAAPFAAIGHQRGAQLLSLILSELNLWCIAQLLATTNIIRSLGARRHALALIAFMPQFVVFGLFVSNDSLACLVGTWTFVAAFDLIDRPSLATIAWFGAMVGVGLLTKGTFLAFAPIAAGAVGLVLWRWRSRVAHKLMALALFIALSVTIGSYKFVENEIHLGHPIVHNMDFNLPWMVEQQGTVTGPASLLTFDVPQLLTYPFETAETNHSVPMLMFATTWYSYIQESNFIQLRAPPWTIVASLLVAAGLIQSTIGLVGLASVVRMVLRVRPRRGLAAGVFASLTKRGVAVGFLVGAIGLVLAAGIHYDAWSCFQGRLVFPAAVGAVLLVAWGYDAAVEQPRFYRWCVHAGSIACYLVFALYFMVETSAVFVGTT